MGIHAFWESRIPELSAENYDHLVGRARYLNHPLTVAWEAVQASHLAVDSVLDLERKINGEYPEDAKFVFEDRGRGSMRFPSREYTQAYEASMNGMVERRMNASIITWAASGTPPGWTPASPTWSASRPRK